MAGTPGYEGEVAVGPELNQLMLKWTETKPIEQAKIQA